VVETDLREGIVKLLAVLVDPAIPPPLSWREYVELQHRMGRGAA
jgi:hypothetical protein